MVFNQTCKEMVFHIVLVETHGIFADDGDEPW